MSVRAIRANVATVANLKPTTGFKGDEGTMSTTEKCKQMRDTWLVHNRTERTQHGCTRIHVRNGSISNGPMPNGSESNGFINGSIPTDPSSLRNSTLAVTRSHFHSHSPSPAPQTLCGVQTAELHPHPHLRRGRFGCLFVGEKRRTARQQTGGGKQARDGIDVNTRATCMNGCIVWRSPHPTDP